MQHILPVIINILNCDFYFSEVTERVWPGVFGAHRQGEGAVHLPVHGLLHGDDPLLPVTLCDLKGMGLGDVVLQVVLDGVCVFVVFNSQNLYQGRNAFNEAKLGDRC